MMTTSPALISRRCTAAKQASSESNTRAGPLCWRRSWPASLTTEPSGDSEPRMMAKPPRGLTGLPTGRTTSCPAVSSAVLRLGDDARAVDGQALLEQPRLEEALGHQAHAAGALEIDGEEPPARLEIGQRRRARRDRVEVLQRRA